MKTARINIRLTPEEKQELTKRAHDHDMTVTEYILYVLQLNDER